MSNAEISTANDGICHFLCKLKYKEFHSPICGCNSLLFVAYKNTLRMHFYDTYQFRVNPTLPIPHGAIRIPETWIHLCITRRQTKLCHMASFQKTCLKNSSNITLFVTFIIQIPRKSTFVSIIL